MWSFKRGGTVERKPACKFIGVVHIKRLSKPCRVFIKCACGRYHLVRGQA